jgi:hypothetical protein
VESCSESSAEEVTTRAARSTEEEISVLGKDTFRICNKEVEYGKYLQKFFMTVVYCPR